MLLRYAYALVNLRPDVATGEGMASLTSVSTSRTCLRTPLAPRHLPNVLTKTAQVIPGLP